MDLPKKRYIIRLDETAIVGPQGPQGIQGDAGAGGSLPIDASDVLYTGNGYTNEPLNNVLDALLYAAPDILSFTADTTNTFEIGTSLTALPVSWSISKDITGGSQTITGSNVVPPTLTDADRDVTVTLSSITASQPILLTVSDGTTPDQLNLQLNFYWPVFYGKATDPGTITSNWLRTNLTKELRADRTVSFSVDAAAGEYAWVAFPIGYGIPSFTENGFSASWVQQHGTGNPFGHVTSQGADSTDTGTWPSGGGGYFVYRSENDEQDFDIVVL
jgi:hypothetical protein